MHGIVLGKGDEVLSPIQYPDLHMLHGHNLITTDGTTLLGADKAGIAEILSAVAELIACDVKPVIKPIRGGTDGARLAFMVSLVRIYLLGGIISTAFTSLSLSSRWSKRLR